MTNPVMKNESVTMNQQLKTSLENSQGRLENIVDNFEDKYQDLPVEAAELWQQAKPKLHGLRDALAAVASFLQSHTEEAHLQAHLATMDGHDQWTYLRDIVTQLSRQVLRKGEAGLDHAPLQAHLAQMDARDFANGKGGEISRDFKLARDKLEQASQRAAGELEHSLESIGNAMSGVV